MFIITNNVTEMKKVEKHCTRVSSCLNQKIYSRGDTKSK